MSAGVGAVQLTVAPQTPASLFTEIFAGNPTIVGSSFRDYFNSKSAATRIDFLGFIIDNKGTHMNQIKVDAILKWETPTNRGEIQRFMGFANFYRRFIPKFSELSKPLYSMTKKEQKMLTNFLIF